MIARLAALSLALSTASCVRTQIVRVPYAVRVECLSSLPPEPPRTEDDDAWARYHVAIEAWAAATVRECGGHLLGASINPAPADTSLIDAGLYGERVR